MDSMIFDIEMMNCSHIRCLLTVPHLAPSSGQNVPYNLLTSVIDVSMLMLAFSSKHCGVLKSYSLSACELIF